jgi:hypothetical protein
MAAALGWAHPALLRTVVDGVLAERALDPALPLAVCAAVLRAAALTRTAQVEDAEPGLEPGEAGGRSRSVLTQLGQVLPSGEPLDRFQRGAIGAGIPPPLAEDSWELLALPERALRAAQRVRQLLEVSKSPPALFIRF